MISNVQSLNPCHTQHIPVTNFKNSARINSDAKLLTGFGISDHTITVLVTVILHISFLLVK